MIFPKDMQVVVLMGGLGSRLADCTNGCPKSMVKIWGKPFFDYQLELMRQSGFRKFLFLVGYKADIIEQYYGSGEEQGIQITYSYDGKELKGTAGAICKAYPYLEENFMVIYGDSFMDISYEETLYRYNEGIKIGKQTLMVVLKNQNKYDKSNVIIKNNQLVLYDKYENKKEMSYIDYGISIYAKRTFERYLKNDYLDLAKIQKEESISGNTSVHIVDRRFYEIGTIQSFNEFKDYAKKRFLEKHPAVFLDRDGVINRIVFNENTEQLDSPLLEEEFELLPQIDNCLKKLSEKEFYLFIVTNQPAAAKGKTKLGKLYDINRKCISILDACGVEIQEIFMCPHYPHKNEFTKEEFLIKECDCRKPKSGLLKKAFNKYNIDLENSYMVGDSYTDILAGKDFGVKTIFLGNFKCDLCKQLEESKPDFICKNIQEVLEIIEKE